MVATPQELAAMRQKAAVSPVVLATKKPVAPVVTSPVTDDDSDLYAFGDMAAFLAAQEAAAPVAPVANDYYTMPRRFTDPLKLSGLTLDTTQDKLDLQQNYNRAMERFGMDKQLYQADANINSAAAADASVKQTGSGAKSYGWSGQTGTAAGKGSAPYGLQPKLWESLLKAQTAMKAEGLGGFKINSGYRSYAEEQRLKQQGYTGAPGTSIHGIGYAVDLQLNDKQKQWLRTNGARFGLFNPLWSTVSERHHWQLLPSLL